MLRWSRFQKRTLCDQRNETRAEKTYSPCGALGVYAGAVRCLRLEELVHQVYYPSRVIAQPAFVVADGEFYQRIVAEAALFLRSRWTRGLVLLDRLARRYIQAFKTYLEAALIRCQLAAKMSGTALYYGRCITIVGDGLSIECGVAGILALY